MYRMDPVAYASEPAKPATLFLSRQAFAAKVIAADAKLLVTLTQSLAQFGPKLTPAYETAALKSIAAGVLKTTSRRRSLLQSSPTSSQALLDLTDPAVLSDLLVGAIGNALANGDVTAEAAANATAGASSVAAAVAAITAAVRAYSCPLPDADRTPE